MVQGLAFFISVLISVFITVPVVITALVGSFSDFAINSMGLFDAFPFVITSIRASPPAGAGSISALILTLLFCS